MHRFFLRGFALLLLFAGSAFAQSPESTGQRLVGAMTAIKAEDWVTARSIAEGTGDTVALAVVEWHRLRKGNGTFADYQSFLRTYADWPGLPLLQAKGEIAMPSDLDPAMVTAYFATLAPQTGTGALLLANALTALGRVAEGRAEAMRAWRDLNLTSNEQARFIDQYEGVLKPLHNTRIDNLLWRGETEQAEKMLPLAGPQTAALAKVRIALRRDAKGINAMINALPADLQNRPGLAYERFLWRIKKDNWDDAATLLLEHTDSAEDLGKPEDWGNLRRSVARREARLDHPKDAYKLASQHFLTAGEDYADLEWLAGWIALRHLNDPKRALPHFQNFRAAVLSPISLGRAGYWLGRAYEAMGDDANAQESYALGATYQTSFYGQLAAERAGLPVDASLAGIAPPSEWQSMPILQSTPIRAGIVFHYADEPLLMQRFFAHVAETASPQEQAALAALALDLGRAHTAIAVAKNAADLGVVLPSPYYPVTELARFASDIEPELAMAIARQESELNPEVISAAGARGLMQVMPATARKVAGNLGVTYSEDQLTGNWRYNAQLGTTYMAGLMDEFSHNYALAAASYNAGPHRVDAWIADYGDPRSPDVDMIDWIEMIPFRETQNYVQRVLESLHVYRARISGQAPPFRLRADLSRN